ncbi:MAG: hypothetical protein Q9196_003937 [Gyalolechia fulgens]
MAGKAEIWASADVTAGPILTGGNMVIKRQLCINNMKHASTIHEGQYKIENLLRECKHSRFLR